MRNLNTNIPGLIRLANTSMQRLEESTLTELSLFYTVTVKYEECITNLIIENARRDLILRE